MVPIIVERKITGTDEETSLFALFKLAALLGTQGGDEVDYLNERLRSEEIRRENILRFS
jgi:hypothetical protein